MACPGTIELKLDEAQTVYFQILAKMFIDGEDTPWLASELGHLMHRGIWKIKGSDLFNFNLNMTVSESEVSRLLQKIPRGQRGIFEIVNVQFVGYEGREGLAELTKPVSSVTIKEVKPQNRVSVVWRRGKSVAKFIKKIEALELTDTIRADVFKGFAEAIDDESVSYHERIFYDSDFK